MICLPQSELDILSRFDLLLSQSTTRSLVQFCAGLGGTILTCSSLLPSLLPSSLAQLISLTLGQYSAWLVAGQKSVSLWSSLVYLTACLTNSLALLSSCCLLYTQVSLAVHHSLARYHLLALLLLVAITAAVSALVQLVVRLCKLSDGGDLDRINLRRGQSTNIINLIGLFDI